MQHSDIDSKRIAVLLSGGVDSSVVVYEFAKLGLHPDCFYIKIGPEDDKEWDCSSEEDLEMATAVAHKYGCNLEVIDCHREYWDQVTRYTMATSKSSTVIANTGIRSPVTRWRRYGRVLPQIPM